MKKTTHIFTSTLFLLLNIATANAQTFEWVKTFGGTSQDVALAGTIDAQGNLYTVGHFQGTVDFDPGVGTHNVASNGLQDIFIQKLDASGNFVWVKSFDGNVESVAVDAQGNVYTVGLFQGTIDFDPGVGTHNLTSNGAKDVFIQKLDALGNFVWAKSFGGTSSEQVSSVAVDAQGNVYAVGNFKVTVDFDPSASMYNLTSTGDYDVFVQKLNALGNFVWAKTFGGSNIDKPNAVTIDAQGNIYTVGYFEGTADFDPNTGTHNLISNGMKDVFIQKLDALGNFLWAKSFGGTSSDEAKSIAVDAQNNVYTVGNFRGAVDFDPSTGTYNLTSNGNYDVFVQKLDASGNFVWAKAFGGSNIDKPNAVTIDAQNNVYTVGYFYGTVDFNPGAGITNHTSNGVSDAFIQKLDVAGNFVWSKSFGGSSYDKIISVAVNAQSSVYTIGSFIGTADFDPSANTHNITSSSGDFFIHKLSQCSSSTGTDAQTACNSYTWIDGNTYTTNNNTATHTLTNTAGCDSIVTLNLTINNPNSGTDLQTACNSYTWIDGNTYTANNNTATHTLTSIGGCDSVVTLNLTIEAMPTISITQNGLSLEVATGMDSYQWYLNNTAVSGATNTTYTATTNGAYYCVVVKGACSQNSDVINISQVNINEIAFEGLKIYPNPAKDILYIEVQEKLEQIQLIDLNGKTVKNFNAESRKLDISTIAKGIYFIKLNNATKQSIQKVVVF